MEKYQYFNGIKFTRDERTGYYLNSKLKKRIHRYVWEFYNGEIPEGYQIHHIDKDKSNNDISNLELIPVSEHAKLHSLEKAQYYHDWMVKNLMDNAVPKSKEWHSSKDGKEWHKKHYEDVKDKFHSERELVCEVCGTLFKTTKQHNTRFCSNRCKSAYRRKIGVDNEIRKCPVCGKEFSVNKYSKQVTCCRSCSNRLRALK